MSNDTDWTPNFGGISTPAPTWAAKRPVRIAILGDFRAGGLAGRLETGAALAKRKPLKVEFDTLDDALGRLDIQLRLPIGAEGAPVEIGISELESFHPDELYRNVEVFSALASLRKRLNTPSTFAAAAAEVSEWADAPKVRASHVSNASRARGATLGAGSTLDDFARLTGRPSVAKDADDAIGNLLRNIVGPFIVPAASPNKDKLVAAVDKALSDAMRAVLHQPDFQNVESLWRGVDFILRRLETSHQLQVHLIDVSAEEFAADLSSVDDLSESGLYKLLVDGPSQDPDGGYAYLVGCYQYDATPPQAELLGRAAHLAAHAGAPFLTTIATDVFTDRKEPPHRLVREAFEALRALPDASYLGLVTPRFMLRNSYGKRSDPISSFAFEEFSRDAGLRGMLWGHPALLAICVLAVKGAPLTVDDLPFHFYVDDDGDTIALPCTERLINTQASAMLRDWGINGVMAHKGEPLVRLAGLEALNGDALAATSRKPPSAGFTPSAARPEPEAAAAEEAPAAEDSAPTAEAPADGGTGDADLDALLASLGASDAPAAGDDAPPAVAETPPEAGDDEMDPELAALLKSLG